MIVSNALIFDGKSTELSAPSNVFVRGSKIESFLAKPISSDKQHDAVFIDGAGKILMPGLISSHSHVMFATEAADDMFMRSSTSIRDLGGPVLDLRRSIDTGSVAGPCTWPYAAKSFLATQ